MNTTQQTSSSTQNIIKDLKDYLEKLELKLELEKKDVILENKDLMLQNITMKFQMEHENEIKNLNKDFQKLLNENKTELKERDERIYFLEGKIKKERIKHENEIKNLIEDFEHQMAENSKQLKKENDLLLKQKDDKIKSLEDALKNKIQKTNSDNENKIEKLNMEQENEIKNLNENIKQLKAENEQKDKKINYFEKKIDELSKVYCNKYVEFINLKNNLVISDNERFYTSENSFKEPRDGTRLKLNASLIIYMKNT